MKKVFILGNPRSGTSLLRLMMNAHPKIVSPPECGFLQWWYEKYKDWSSDSNSPENIQRFVRDLSSSKKIETWSLDFDRLSNLIQDVSPDSYSSLTELIYIFYSMSTTGTVDAIVDKNNYYINHLENLNAIWPDASFIHLVRDGRDVACSYLEINKLETSSPYKPMLSSKIVDIAREWSDNNQRISNFLQKIGSEKGLVIRYEDLLSDTSKELQKICDFIGLPFDSLMLSYYKPEFHDEPDETMDWKKKTLSPPDVENIGRYKSMLSLDDINLFNQIAEKTILQFNYDVK